jgi:hypothetical protein
MGAAPRGDDEVFGLIRVNPRKSVARLGKINAAQASHLGRIARECDVSGFHRAKRRNVKPGNRTPEGAYVYRHTLETINPQIQDSQILIACDCGSGGASPAF